MPLQPVDNPVDKARPEAVGAPFRSAPERAHAPKRAPQRAQPLTWAFAQRAPARPNRCQARPARRPLGRARVRAQLPTDHRTGASR